MNETYLRDILKREHMFFKAIHERRRKRLFDSSLWNGEVRLFLQNKAVELWFDRNSLFEVFISDIAVFVPLIWRKTLIEKIVEHAVNHVQFLHDESVALGGIMLDLLQERVGVFLRFFVEVQGTPEYVRNLRFLHALYLLT